MAPHSTGSHTTLLSMDLDLRAWGRNNEGQLGNGDEDGNNVGDGDDEMGDDLIPVDIDRNETMAPSAYPTAAPTLYPQPRMCLNDHQTCSVYDDEVKCWGLAYVANPMFSEKFQSFDEIIYTVPIEPCDIGVGFNPLFPVCGGEHTCAVSDDGRARCWGLPTSGQLGYGNKKYFFTSENSGRDIDVGSDTVIEDMVCRHV